MFKIFIIEDDKQLVTLLEDQLHKFGVDGYRNYSISLYAGILSGCLLMGYLVYRYLTHRNFYKRLEEPHASLDEFLEIDSGAPVARGLHQL